jgi:HAD superfamily hydrolase (TIGR01509 family)
MNIRVLAFDLDDTLWDMKQTLLRAESLLAKWLSENCQGFSYDIKQMRGIREHLLLEDPTLAVDLSLLRKKVIETALRAADYQKDEAITYAERAFDVFFSARNQVTFFDGAIASLQKLSEDYVLGSLTNGNADIRKLGLSNYFSFAYSAADVGSPKPAPDLFNAALKHTKTKPEQMIYIGDHPFHDIDAAKQIGIRTIWVNREKKQYTGTTCPDQEIIHLGNLPDAVDNIDNSSSAD